MEGTGRNDYSASRLIHGKGTGLPKRGQSGRAEQFGKRAGDVSVASGARPRKGATSRSL